MEGSYKPALIVVDMQEDFCPPVSTFLELHLKRYTIILPLLKHGSLAVAGAREIVPLINSLLSLPFALKIATQDFHPADHISFETSHVSPEVKAFESTVEIKNPYDNAQTYDIPIWPVHCVQGTKGAEIIPEIERSKFNHIVEKGKDSRVEMFSGFGDVFGNRTSIAASLDLARLLKDAAITHLFVTGVAGDHCVRCTALDGRNEGFDVFVIEEATRSVDGGEKGWHAAKRQFATAGIAITHMNGPELDRVKGLAH